jgi:hypothetical protein
LGWNGSLEEFHYGDSDQSDDECFLAAMADAKRTADKKMGVDDRGLRDVDGMNEGEDAAPRPVPATGPLVFPPMFNPQAPPAPPMPPMGSGENVGTQQAAGSAGGIYNFGHFSAAATAAAAAATAAAANHIPVPGGNVDTEMGTPGYVERGEGARQRVGEDGGEGI